MQKSVEAYLRNLYAFGPDVQVTVGPLKETSIPGLLATDITVKVEDNVQAVQFYVSKDGKYLLRGELSDLTKDPTAENRAKLQIKDAPVWGDPKASDNHGGILRFRMPGLPKPPRCASGPLGQLSPGALGVQGFPS